MSFSDKNRGGKLGGPDETAEIKSEMPADPISTVLNELAFDDTMKRSIIFGICTRLVNSGAKTMPELVSEIKINGPLEFIKNNMNSGSNETEAASGRETTKRRRPISGPLDLPGPRRSSSVAMKKPSTEEIASAQKELEAKHAAELAAQRAPEETGDSLLQKIRERMGLGESGGNSEGGNK